MHRFTIPILAVLALLNPCLSRAKTCSKLPAAEEVVAASADQATAVSVLQALEPLLVEQQQAPGAGYVSLAREDLPRVRPAQPWPYRKLSSALSIVEPATDPATGVLSFTVAHAPLAKVTVKQLVWFFNQDLEKVTRYVGDGKYHSLNLQMHPRDHCRQPVIATGPPANSSQGDTLLIKQFFNASKMFTRSQFAGFDAAAESQLSTNASVVFLNASGLEVQLLVSGVMVTSFKHVWSNGPAGAQVVTTSQLGNKMLGAALNKFANCVFSRGAEPLLTAQKVLLHSVEEVGNLEKILPGLYARRNNL